MGDIQDRELDFHPFDDEVGDGVVLLRDTMQFDPLELVLELPHLLAVRRHQRDLAGGLLHDLVDDQL